MLLRLLLVLPLSPFVWAQNTDTAILFSFRRSSVQIQSSPTRLTATSNEILIGFMTAVQVRERGPHRLYIEFPVIQTGGRSVDLSGGAVRSRGGLSTFSVGPRYQYTLSPRWALYGATDFGAATYRQSTVTRNFVGSSREANPLVAFGAGLDFRLSKFLSVRGDFRQFTLLGDPPGKRHAFTPSFGLALHF
ncbi:MAG: hypothetical protein K2X03_22640 [Bryobacteraceae bacterium]|nr:hypothetical protein [Bryobacteraceae bacterium]